MTGICQKVGAANPDIAGIGIIVSFAFQAVLAFFLSVFGELLVGGKDEETTARSQHLDEFEPNEVNTVTVREQNWRKAVQKLRREALKSVLLACSDIQTTIGLSLALAAIIQYNSLTLYQYHVIYDSISFVSISNCAAMAFVGEPIRRMYSRIVLVGIFFSLYIVFVILFGIRLHRWDDTRAGYCYNSKGLATSGSAHPTVDEVYLAITVLYMCAAYNLVVDSVVLGGWTDDVIQEFMKRYDKFWSTLPSRLPKPFMFLSASQSMPRKNTNMGSWAIVYEQIIKLNPGFSKHRHSFETTTQILTRLMRPTTDLPLVVSLALCQLPLHLYFLIRIRLSNEPFLEQGGSENDWGFGQIYALVSSAAVLMECARSFSEYRKERKELEELPPSPSPSPPLPLPPSSSTKNQRISRSRVFHQFTYDVK